MYHPWQTRRPDELGRIIFGLEHNCNKCFCILSNMQLDIENDFSQTPRPMTMWITPCRYAYGFTDSEIWLKPTPYSRGTTLCINISLRWRHNDHDGVSNHQPHGCLLNRLFRRRSKKTSKLRVTALVWGIHRDRWIPAQRASYAENVSIWWRHHDAISTDLLFRSSFCDSRIFDGCY